ncbi:MAG TPA: ATP-dependent 6-phosphofructokinase [Polyangiaceae bacterium]|nr:ATP-dependent 6-phosphofructokinase [Polyangiaceae bacterium]
MESNTRPRRVCILVGGGDAPGVNAVVRGFVHAARHFSLEVLGSRYGFEGLTASEGIVPLSIADIRGILPKGGCSLGCSTRLNPFFASTRSSGTENEGPAIVDRLRSLGVEALVLVGGDGTTVAAIRFNQLGMPCICVPKTIDNDLGQTDVACGFDSAVETVTRAVDALHSTAEAHSRVMLVEVMGRGAGFIALNAGVAGGADVILIPEIPYRLEHVVAKIREREALGLRFSIVVVAEGAKPVGGETLEVEAGSPGHLARLGGAGERLRRELEAANLGHEIRLTVLGHLQRGGSPSAFDRNLGTQLGTYAAELCHRGEYPRRIVVRDGHLDAIALPAEEERQLHKRVTLAEDPMVRAARLVGIELGAPLPARA